MAYLRFPVEDARLPTHGSARWRAGACLGAAGQPGGGNPGGGGRARSGPCGGAAAGTGRAEGPGHRGKGAGSWRTQAKVVWCRIVSVARIVRGKNLS